jgi:hypothetical protein
MLCSRCGVAPSRVSHRWCLGCHAANMRAWRLDHCLSEEARAKDRCRSYAGSYKRRGKIRVEACGVCGGGSAEMHHADYSRPLLVEWLCRGCHLLLHKRLLANVSQ